MIVFIKRKKSILRGSNCLSSEGMVYSDYKKQRIVFWRNEGLKAPSICKKLRSEGLSCTREEVYKFLLKYEATGSICRKEGLGRWSKVTGEVKDIIEKQMQADDETTVAKLQKLLERYDHHLSKSAIIIVQCRRRRLVWSFCGTAYCQLV